MSASSLHLENLGAPAWRRLAGLVADAKRNELLAPVTVVVPSLYVGLSLRRTLATEKGLANVRFMVTARLAEHLGASSLAHQGKVPLTPLAELAAIRATAVQMAGPSTLGRLAHQPGLHQSLRNTFRDLAQLSSQGLRHVESADQTRAQIVEWYRHFTSRLSRHYTREELARAAGEAVARGGVESALRDLGTIIFHMVQDLSPAETDLVFALARAHRCVVVLGLTGDEEADLISLRLASRLTPVLGTADPPTSPSSQRSEAQHLVSAPDADEEVRWVLRHIARSAEEGVPFYRMAVVYRQREPYAALVCGQLRLAGIPMAGPEPRSLADTPAGKLLLLLQAVLESEFSRESVMRWIAEAPVKAGTDGGTASAQLLRWEAISRKAGVVAGVPNWLARLDRYRENTARQLREADRLDETSPARLRELRETLASASDLKSFIRGLEAKTTLPDESSWSAYARWARQLLRDYAFEVGQWPAEEQDAYDRVLAKLDDLAGLDNLESEIDLAGFFLMLGEALSSSSGRLGQYGSGVFVAPLATCQGMDFENVYVVGMAEGVFPPPPRDDALLPDRLQQTLSDGDGLSLSQARVAEERRLFLSALASGRSRVLTYPRADTAAQRGRSPSPWLLEAAGLLHGSPVPASDLAALSSEEWLSVVESHQDGLEHARHLAYADTPDYDVASVARWHASGRSLDAHFLASDDGTLRRTLRLVRGRQGSAFTVWDGRLSSIASQSRRLRLSVGGELSPTRLERWASCPFRYFLGDVLGLSALDSPEELLTITPPDRGVLIHRILERLVRESGEGDLLPDFGEPWGDWHRSLLREIAEQEFEGAENRGVTGSPLLWSVVRDEILEDLSTFLTEDSTWRAERQSRPESVERRFGFGDGDSLPPLEVTLPDGTQIRFRGQIDRVDTNRSGSEATVIDYKSGVTGPFDDMRRDPLGAGRHLQLPVYAMSVQSGAESSLATDGLYWFVTARGNFQRRSMRLSEVEDRFKEIVQTIVSGIGNGVFPADPGAAIQGGFRNCRNCDFDRICPSNRGSLWDRKRQDPAVAGYVRLSEVSDK